MESSAWYFPLAVERGFSASYRPPLSQRAMAASCCSIAPALPSGRLTGTRRRAARGGWVGVVVVGAAVVVVVLVVVGAVVTTGAGGVGVGVQEARATAAAVAMRRVTGTSTP